MNNRNKAIELLEKSRPCHAVIWHGPGHQGKTSCYLRGKHTTHETRYGRDDQLARWTGDEVFSGFFDEPPKEPEETDEGVGTHKARILRNSDQEGM